VRVASKKRDIELFACRTAALYLSIYLSIFIRETDTDTDYPSYSENVLLSFTQRNKLYRIL